MRPHPQHETPPPVHLYNIPEVWVCHIPPIEPLQLGEVVQEVGGVVAQGAKGVGPMGGVREGELLQVGEGEEWVHILRGRGRGGGGGGRGGRGGGVGGEEWEGKGR